MKPFLRWAGGKKWLIKHIDQFVDPNQFNNYHEPFIGGGSIFFHLQTNHDCFLSDLNEELINTYIHVRDNVEEVIDQLKTFDNTEEFYYHIRGQNIEEQALRAARFIYLNQTSFNGLYRVNLQGVYNVPYGYRSKDFVQEDLLRQASSRLEGVNLTSSQFDDGVNNIQAGDLIFLDPPYTITHNNNGFIKYNEKLFSEGDQYRLAKFINRIIEIGASYIMTNAAHHEIRNIFNMENPIVVNRASLIGGKNAKRGNYEEFLFTNITNDGII